MSSLMRKKLPLKQLSLTLNAPLAAPWWSSKRRHHVYNTASRPLSQRWELQIYQLNADGAVGSVTLALLPPTSRCLLFFCTHLGAASSYRSESAERPFKGTTQPSHTRPAFKRTPAVTGAGRRSFHKSSYVTRFDNLASLWGRHFVWQSRRVLPASAWAPRYCGFHRRAHEAELETTEAPVSVDS